MRNNESNTALVTGATGYIGSQLVRQLASTGWTVHVITRPGSSTALLDDVRKDLTFHLYDGSMASLSTCLNRSKPDIVFHLASLFLSQHTPEDIHPLIDSNILFSTQLTEAMIQQGAMRLVNTGTSWQHYHDQPAQPVNLYAATKQAFETILDYYLATSGLQVVNLLLFDTYGPGDPRPKLLNLLAKIARSGEILPMSPGEQLLDIVYIDDVIAAFLVAAERLLAASGEKCESFAVSAGHHISLRDFVATVARTTGWELNIEWGGRPYRPREVMTPWSTGESLPGWRPNVSLEEGLRRIACASA